MPDVVLVDTSHLLYRSAHTFKALENKRGEPTGIHFGVMRSIEHLKKVCPNSFIIFCLDGTGRFRKEFYSGYKAQRAGSPSSHSDIVHEFGIRMDVMDLVKAAGCAIVHHIDHECDDLIAMLALAPDDYLPVDKNSQIIIYSGDDDFCQLVTERVSVLKPPPTKQHVERWMNVTQVYKEWGVYPTSMALYRSFLGDDGDNIPRLPRIPRDRLQLAVEGKTNPIQFYDGDGLAWFQPVWQSKLTAFRAQCEINYRLTRLPWTFEDRIPIEYLECGLDIGKLQSLLNRLEFTSILKKIGAIEELLRPTSYAKALSAVSNRSQSRSDEASRLESVASRSRLETQSPTPSEAEEIP